MQPFQHLNNRQLAISNWRWVRGRSGPLTDNRLPATAVDDRSELLGVGGNALKKLEFLQHAARALGDGAERVVANIPRHPSLFCDQPVNAAQQRPAARHDYATV